jgi:hypothetical protein
MAAWHILTGTNTYRHLACERARGALGFYCAPPNTTAAPLRAN